MNSFPDFFDLSVYRLPEKQYYKEQEEFINEAVESTGLIDHDAEIVNRIRERARINFGGPWQYNEIIGYIRLHFVGSQIRGEYYSPNTNRIVKTRKKVFWLRTHKLAPEVSIPFDPTSEQIFSLLVEYVNDCRKELPQRFIDTRQLMRIGPFVDWKKLYETLLKDED